MFSRRGTEAETERMGSRFRAWLAHRRSAPWIVLAGLIALSPTLSNGIAADDHYLRLVARGAPELPEIHNAPLDMFSFMGKGLAERQARIERGLLPWWTPDDAGVRFWRPLSAATHWLDFHLWSDHPWVMHAHSLLWYGVLTVVALGIYRRMEGATWAAGLAGLMFALDDAHGIPAGWLAARNAVLAAVFGLLCLWAHDRWVRDRRRGYAALALLFLAVGLLCGESAAGALGYLIAHALFIDQERPRLRLLRLAPYLLLTIAWRWTYIRLGYGVAHSGLYLDPGAHPIAFIAQAARFLPLLMLGQFALPNATAHVFLPARWAVAHLGLAVGFMALLLWVFAPMLRRDRTARFWACGLLLSTAPICATWPQDRLMVLSGIGAMALVARLIALARDPDSLQALRGGMADFGRPRRMATRGLAWLLIALHLVLAPFGLVAGGRSILTFSGYMEWLSDTLPAEEAASEQDIVLVSTPLDLFTVSMPMLQASQGRPVPRRTLALYVGVGALDIRRPDAYTLLIAAEDGFLKSPYSVVFRSPELSPMRAGDRVELRGVSIEVLSVTDDGRALEVMFRFDTPLKQAAAYWFTWSLEGYRPFELPAPGDVKHLDRVPLREWGRSVLRGGPRTDRPASLTGTVDGRL